jgi:hypothetical protein
MYAFLNKYFSIFCKGGSKWPYLVKVSCHKKKRKKKLIPISSQLLYVLKKRTRVISLNPLEMSRLSQTLLQCLKYLLWYIQFSFRFDYSIMLEFFVKY